MKEKSISFAENLKTLRIQNGMQQKELAEKLSVSNKTISHWETGESEPDLVSLIKLKKHLDVTYEDLLE